MDHQGIAVPTIEEHNLHYYVHEHVEPVLPEDPNIDLTIISVKYQQL